MASKQKVSRIWRSPLLDLPVRLDECIRGSLNRRPADKPVQVFFRADDIGVTGKQFGRLIQLFSRLKVPLALAVVPSWLTPLRWSRLMSPPWRNSSLFCWHQHGWRHKNHEKELKKQEFGPSRSTEAITRDLLRGHARLVSIMQENFFPLFTPPWNRCSREALDILERLNYRAVSRFAGAHPPAPEGLPDIPVRVDLHTRRDTRPAEGWQNLFAELQNALSEDCCGIMIHHQRMNEAAFQFLACLLECLVHAKGCRLVSMKDLIE